MGFLKERRYFFPYRYIYLYVSPYGIIYIYKYLFIGMHLVFGIAVRRAIFPCFLALDSETGY